MNGHIDNGDLQDFREGLLSPEDEERVRIHLEGCPACRAELEALSRVLEELGRVPQDAEPPRDLWPQIAWRIEGGTTAGAGASPKPHVQGDGVPVAAREVLSTGPKEAKRITLRAWQLLAASITIALISGASVWAFLGGGATQDQGVEETARSAALFAGLGEAYSGYDEAISDLEAVLEQGRGVLDPETIQALQKNLDTIDRAIQEAGEALEQDPASTVLQRILANNLRRKVDLLRHAAVAVFANT
jgi:hypothetical protein